MALLRVALEDALACCADRVHSECQLASAFMRRPRGCHVKAICSNVVARELRFFGLRASEAALVCLNHLPLIREGRATELDVMQPKTGCFRKVLVPDGLVHVLRVELSSDLSTLLLAAGEDGTSCLDL